MVDDRIVSVEKALPVESGLPPAYDSNRLLGMAESIAHVGYWHFDHVRQHLFWSDEVKRIHGYSLDADPTIEAALLAYGPGPAERERIAAIVDRALTDGKPYAFESQITTTSGDVRDVVSSGHAERDADGAITGIVGIVQDVSDRKRAERERDRVIERLTLANKAGQVGIWDYDPATHDLIWDANQFALYRIDPNVADLNAAWSDALHPYDRARVVAEIDAALADGGALDTEFRIVWPSGDAHVIRSLGTVVRDSFGAACRFVGTNWDITEVRTLAEQLQREKDASLASETRYRALADAMPLLVSVIDADGLLDYVNERWVTYTGYTLEQIREIGRERMIDPDDLAMVEAYRAIEPAQEFECEVRLRRSDGVFRHHLFRSVPFADWTAGSRKWIVSATDIEDRKNAELRLEDAAAELAHLAHHDPMTDLPNRKLLMARLGESIARAARNEGGVIVLYLDLDRFKAINDRLGHAAGDRVLAEVGRRISATMRAGDTASRVGGDEFVLVCSGRDDGDDAESLARRLIATVAEPIETGGAMVTIGASIGISRYPADDIEADALIRKADAAMYAAKQSGRNAYRVYTSAMDVALASSAEFEAELHAAIAHNQFEVFYQPMMSLHTGQLVGAEALVRWRHPTRGLLSPGEFIPFAEENGFIAQIGDIVLQQACAQLKRLDLAADSEFSLAVNVSAHQFARADFLQTIATAVAGHDIDVTRLEIEITESTVMGNTTATIAILTALKTLGVRLSLDDFGTGYSSLAYIKNFPIDTLKIDRSFVRDIAHNRTDQALAKTIITLAHSLGMRVVGEGVETHAQLEALRTFGSDLCQGYLVSHPLPDTQFTHFARTFSPLTTISAA